jgi:hypothetical protein
MNNLKVISIPHATSAWLFAGHAFCNSASISSTRSLATKLVPYDKAPARKEEEKKEESDYIYIYIYIYIYVHSVN